MKPHHKTRFPLIALLVVAASVSLTVFAQTGGAVLTGAELTRVVPTSFYFQGQSAPTQMRNAAAARFGTNHFVIVGLVDTSGYSAEIRARYEGFFITDSSISVGGETLPIGAYGFGFSNDGKVNILDLAGTQILSIATTKDNALRRPRPLMMTADGGNVRLYRGRDYVVIGTK
jgi:hypothetical protein